MGERETQTSVVALDKCVSCCGSSLEEEQGQIICTECGVVQQHSNSILRHDVTQNEGTCNPSTAFFGLNALPDRMKHQLSKRRQKDTLANVECLKDVLGIICDKFCFSSCMKKQAELMTRQALTGRFKGSPSEKKKAVTIVCCYIILKQYAKPGTINDLCNSIQICKSTFAKAHSAYLKAYPSNKPLITDESDTDIELILKSLLKPVTNVQESNEILNRSQNLIQVFTKNNIKSSKLPKPTIYAALFIAWKSHPKDASRLNVSFCQFKEKLNFKLPSDLSDECIKRRIRELEKCLIELLFNLQLVPKGCNTDVKKKLPLFLVDILNNASHLIYDARLTSQALESQRSCKKLPSPVKGPIDGDAEISDSEIDSYLRGADEIAAIKKIRQSIDH